LKLMGFRMDNTGIREGVSKARCVARIEVMNQRPLAIVDSAHNPASTRALVDVINEALPGRGGVLVFAANRDKDVPNMLRDLLPTFSKCVLTTIENNPRGMSVERLAEDVSAIQREIGDLNIDVFTAKNAAAAWEKAKQIAGDDDFVCIAGSFFLAAELRALVGQIESPRQT
jgi:dihydrofolate synthase/folylpolyglutamate synthase